MSLSFLTALKIPLMYSATLVKEQPLSVKARLTWLQPHRVET